MATGISDQGAMPRLNIVKCWTPICTRKPHSRTHRHKHIIVHGGEPPPPPPNQGIVVFTERPKRLPRQR